MFIVTLKTTATQPFPLRILAFSGSHENRSVTEAFLKRVVDLGDPPDVFVSAGDLGPISSSRIFRALADRDVPILYVLGNHVLHHPTDILDMSKMEIQRLPNVHALNDSVFVHDGWTFIGQDAWTDFTDDEIDPGRYRDLIEKSKGVDPDSAVLVTHHAPLGIFDMGASYPLHSFADSNGILHAGSLAIRFYVNQFAPRIHIFAHCHADGNRSSVIDGTLFANVCHLERRSREGGYGVTGSFEVIDTDAMDATSYHLSQPAPRACPACGKVNYIRYRRCLNCTKGSTGIIAKEDLP